MRDFTGSRKDDFEKFLYGETCSRAPSKEYTQVVNRGKRNFSTLKIKPMTWASSTPLIYGLVHREGVKFVPQGIPISEIKYKPRWDEELKKIRDLLNLSHQDLADVLKITKKTVLNIESGGTKEPQKKISDRLDLFLKLIKALCLLRNNKKYQIISFFKSPSPNFSGQTPLEHLKSGDDFALNDVLGLVMRMSQ